MPSLPSPLCRSFRRLVLRSKSRTTSSAFSLVEVTLALGVISFGLISLLGMLPVGLATYSSAVDATVVSQIGQSVLADARQARFSNLGDMEASSPLFYDIEGRTSRTDGANVTAANYVYRADIQVEDGIDLPSGNGTHANDRIRKVTVTLRKVSSSQAIKTYHAWISDNGL